MGDARRHIEFAKRLKKNIPLDARIADVAGGKGKLQAAMRQIGFSDVVSIDKRRKCLGPRRNYKYGLFDYQSASREFGAVVGMHPDQGTDHIICYAVKHRVPFAVVPCCVLPSAKTYQGYRYEHWIDHLTQLAERGHFNVNVTTLPIKGRNIMIIGRPAA